MHLSSNLNNFFFLETFLYSSFFPKESIQLTKELICNTSSHIIDIFYIKSSATTDHLLQSLYSECSTPILLYNVQEIIQKPDNQTKLTTKLLIINSLDQVDIFMEVINEYRFRKERRKYIVVIELVRESNQEQWLYYLFAKFWRKQILNVVVIFHKQSVQVYTYQLLADIGSPDTNISKATAIQEQNFNLNVINITDHHTSDLFFNKLKNLQRRQLVVTMFPLVSRAILNKDGTAYTGIDGHVAELVRSRMNATFKYITPKMFFNGSKNTGIVGDLIEKRAHFAFNVHAYAPYNFNYTVEQTNAYDHVKFCVIVPKNGREPIAFNIFHSLSPITWLLVIGSVIIVTTAFVAIQTIQRAVLKTSTNYSGTEFAAITLQSFFGDSITRFTSNMAIRGIFLGWLIYSFFITNAFTATIISTLIKPNYIENINTIEDLGKSNLTILYPKFIGQNLKNGFDDATWEFIGDNLKEVESWEKFIHIMQTNKTQYAYVLANYHCVYMVNSNVDEKTGESIFHMVPECLASHPKVYLFQRGSMYLGYINELLGQFHEMGMFRKWIAESNFWSMIKGMRISDKAINYSEVKVVITMEYLQTAFYMLCAGLLLSAIVFCLEKLWYKYVDLPRRLNSTIEEEIVFE